MLNIAGIFKNRVVNLSRLVEFGFAKGDKEYTASYNILNEQFQMNVIITGCGRVTVCLIDADSREEYVLVHTPCTSGAFVGAAIQACEEQLVTIAEACFDYRVFGSEQAAEIIAYAEKIYRSTPEFLWEKFPNNAVLRRSDGGKWYAALLTVAQEKLGLEGTQAVEIIDLRGFPEEIEGLIDGKNYFPGYHMNKKHWYTICLNGSVPMQEICRRMDSSYLLAKK